MPNPSPSPPVTTTCRLWFAIFTPVATANARQCSVCMPYVLMKPGRLEEQPMPLMVTTLCGAMFISASTFSSEDKTPKSPQPGHQSGSTFPLKSAAVNGCDSSTVAISAPFYLTSGHHPDRFGTPFRGLLTTGRSPALNHDFVHRHGQLCLVCLGR